MRPCALVKISSNPSVTSRSDPRGFFGGDANTYDALAGKLADIWTGVADERILDAVDQGRLHDFLGMGMYYWIAALYTLIGRNILAAQSVCGVIGAATAPLLYSCAVKVFVNRNVGRIAAALVALFPAMVIWSSQLLKDGLIVFFLVLVMTAILKLQNKFSYIDLMLAIGSLGAIAVLRFYIFYIVATAVVASLLVGVSTTPQSVFRRTIVLAVLGLGLTYLGVIRGANMQFERFGTLDRIQISRADLARAGSGFGEDIDVSTTGGALTALPVGFTYLMLAPFPWQVGSLRQSMTIPETFVWWSLIPIMIAGIWYTLKRRLREAFPILFFSLMLTLAYSLFQGNVGTAYRQRTQIQVFLFMFVAVGWTLIKERRENRKLIRIEKQRRLDRQLHAMRLRQ